MRERLGIDGTVSRDLEFQAVKIGTLSNTGIADVHRDLLHRVEVGVHGDNADRGVSGLELVGGDIATARGDLHLERERCIAVQRCNMDVRRQDLDVGVFREVLGGDFTVAGHIQAKGFVVIRKELDADALEIQDNVGDIFLHTRNRRKFLLNAFDFHGDNSRTLQRGEERTAESVAEGDTPATFQGFYDKLGVAAVFAGLNFLEAARHLK
jgi:hypothetical protein